MAAAKRDCLSRSMVSKRFVWMAESVSCILGATDDEVYGLAVRYYLEDVKVVDTKIGNHVRIVCDQIIELTEEEKEEARQKAIRQYQEEELHKLQSRKKPAVKKEIQVQPSLFDSQYETAE